MLFGESSCIACDGAINGSGSFNYALTAGQSYTFNLRSFSWRNYDAGTADFDPQFADDLFSYSITAIPHAVPEPASWAMMIAGFGLVGAGMRRRKVTPALA